MLIWWLYANQYMYCTAMTLQLIQVLKSRLNKKVLLSRFNPTWCGVFDIRYGVWGGAESARRQNKAPKVNWGHYRCYQSWQILFLTSLPVCRALEQSPMSYSFAVRGRRSDLLSPRKIIRFQYAQILTSSIFELHGQYVHQIKAENILNSNLTWKMSFVLKN